MAIEILTPHLRDLGGGFTVRRVLPARARQTVGPFIFFDHFGPTDMAPGQGVDVRPHPHIGLSTVSYLFGGQVTHRDSLGVEQIIRPGEVNWMTAGKGIIHEEFQSEEFSRKSGIFQMVQLWVNLRAQDKNAKPQRPVKAMGF